MYNKPTIKKHILLIYLLTLLISNQSVLAQTFSKARVWNEVVLNAIRNDFARPTVHARNLFHTSIAMYDAFAVYDDINEPYFLGKTVGGFTCDFEGIVIPSDIQVAREMAMSYAVFRIIEHRFKNAPRAENILFNAEQIMAAAGYDINYRKTDYASGYPAALGNYIGEKIIEFGLQDGANEMNDYANEQYVSINPVMNPFEFFLNPGLEEGNQFLNDPNRWQKLEIPNLVDQSGNLLEGGSPDFLSAEWGKVTPFALTNADLSIEEKDNKKWHVYHNPGPPVYLDTVVGGDLNDHYKWGFTLVAKWNILLRQDTSVKMDISPASIGNLTHFPFSAWGLRAYYNFEDGGDYSSGHATNPVTGVPYQPQIVSVADYGKAIAEWWADGPNSETPPGHWFRILNYVNDQTELERRYKGRGAEMGRLAWDVKAYFVLGGAMHDAAISAWSNKGYYDYVRPISAIRYMINKGQCSDPNAPNYNKNGIPLIPEVIEQILDGDLLLFDSSYYGDIKLYNYKSSNGNKIWSFGDRWLPHQDISFVTPSFAGYVSEHSTFSRAAAEVLSEFTGNDFFPGGMGEFLIEANELNISGGLSKSLSLQWATYRDAANQSAISRIWGGMHPPIDDMSGRIIGEKVGIAAMELANQYFGPEVSINLRNIDKENEVLSLFPNPIHQDYILNIYSSLLTGKNAQVRLYDQQGREVFSKMTEGNNASDSIDLSFLYLRDGMYQLKISSEKGIASKKVVILK